MKQTKVGRIQHVIPQRLKFITTDYKIYVKNITSWYTVSKISEFQIITWNRNYILKSATGKINVFAQLCNKYNSKGF